MSESRGGAWAAGRGVPATPRRVENRRPASVIRSVGESRDRYGGWPGPVRAALGVWSVPFSRHPDGMGRDTRPHLQDRSCAGRRSSGRSRGVVGGTPLRCAELLGTHRRTGTAAIRALASLAGVLRTDGRRTRGWYEDPHSRPSCDRKAGGDGRRARGHHHELRSPSGTRNPRRRHRPGYPQHAPTKSLARVPSCTTAAQS